MESELTKLYQIADALGEEEILCQLSEECAELIQASMKYRRAVKGLTPVSQEDAINNLSEELADVTLILEQILYLFENTGIESKVKQTMMFKANRWYERLGLSK